MSLQEADRQAYCNGYRFWQRFWTLYNAGYTPADALAHADDPRDNALEAA